MIALKLLYGEISHCGTMQHKGLLGYLQRRLVDPESAVKQMTLVNKIR